MTARAAVLLLATLPIAAQNTTVAPHTTATHHATVRRTTTAHSRTTAHHAATAESPLVPVLPASIPAIHATPKPLYTLVYADITKGTGAMAEQRKWLTVHYTGWLTDGTKFDSSVDRGEPITFPYGARQVIAGWDTGFEGMQVGGKRRLYVPYQLGYGEAGRPPKIPAKSMLIFDVELLGVADTPPAPPAQHPATPAQPSAPPQTGTAQPNHPTGAATSPSQPNSATPPPHR
jgi:peptidylprolyl isomerase